jgi:hypothetical protein
MTDDEVQRKRETYGSWAAYKTDQEIKNVLNRFGSALDEIESLVKSRFGKEWDYEIVECEFDGNAEIYLNCEVLMKTAEQQEKAHISNIQCRGESKFTSYYAATAVFEVHEDELNCTIDELLEAFEETYFDNNDVSFDVDDEWINLTIRNDEYEPYSFDVNDVEKYCAELDEIIKSHTK